MSHQVRLRPVFRSAVVLTLVAITAAAVPGSASAQVRAPRLGSRVLRHGMNGPDVRVLQQDLTQSGLPTPANGRFGPLTATNVRDFERSHRLVVNGSVNRRFVRELLQVLSPNFAHAAFSGSGGSSLGTIQVTGPPGGKAKWSKPKPKPKSSKASGTSPPAPTPTPIGTTAPTGAPVTPGAGTGHLGDRTLRRAMRGHDVRVLQGYLTLAGFPTSVDGVFGPATEANVIQFEQARGLPADGVVTYAVSLVLRQAVAQLLAGGAVSKATIGPDGRAVAPSGAPVVVQAVIASANQIIDKPYIYAGGHQRWKDSGYDCSGAVSYALHGAGLLSSPEDSTGLESYGSPGPGKWITIYANSGHTWVVAAGIAFDTANYGGPNIPAGSGPRWRTNPTGNLNDGGGYVVRHPSGL